MSQKKLSFRKNSYWSLKYGSNFMSKDSFEKFRIWGFQNCPNLIKLMKKHLRYLRSKLSTLLSGTCLYSRSCFKINRISSKFVYIWLWIYLQTSLIRLQYHWGCLWALYNYEKQLLNPKRKFFLGHTVLVLFITRKERRGAPLISRLCFAKLAVCLFKSHWLNFNYLKPSITKLNHSN